MDDIQRLKRYIQHSTKEEINKNMLLKDPCDGCPSQKSCVSMKKGRYCGGVAKEMLEKELKKIEKKKSGG